MPNSFSIVAYWCIYAVIRIKLIFAYLDLHLQGPAEAVRNIVMNIQGGESRDLFWLFCTCIRTEQVRKLFSTSLILSEFPCGTMKEPCLRMQQMNIEVSYVMRCIFLRDLELRLSVFARGCVAKYSVHSNSS